VGSERKEEGVWRKGVSVAGVWREGGSKEGGSVRGGWREGVGGKKRGSGDYAHGKVS